ncbi:histidine phosphatase family protein [archaeon]|jgi:2,3-bisphosphoglycerate-dependent phosphoglycerate mutase|nr:histidine phosphatase family protein [archaeon]MBT3577296.1 histidine phosphatase family protein [archaeon]MBT6820460.1 histidine phosphatase family protein [archaeon]MBT6956285.1 histidine phosphatase family protein [archaeon]MBT7025274.1 histidine phosphatase family protein [archaeon]
MKKGLKIYLFRHGRTEYNVGGKFTGHNKTRLTKSGIDDAKIVAIRLKNKKFQVAFKTKLPRSTETLKEVLKFHPECKTTIEDNKMIERAYGTLQGSTHLSVVKKHGPAKYDLWHRGWTNRPPKGESFADVEKRVKKFITNLKKFMKKNNVNVAISAHGNSIRLFRRIMEGISIKETTQIFVPYDVYFEYDV